MADLVSVLTFLAALGAGLVAGLFFAFSAVVMGSLERLPAALGISAMQTINVVVLNVWFFSAFFGTALLCIAVAALSLLAWSGPSSLYALFACALYLLGAIWVTIAFNVPLNDALKRVTPDSDDGAMLWQRYLRVWTAWNHVRTIAPLAASALFILALR
jgi:uncharacterized membrane protein